MSELKRLGVKIVTGAMALEVLQDGLKFEKDGVEDTLLADSVVIATGAKPEKELLQGMEDLVSIAVASGSFRKKLLLISQLLFVN